MSAQRSAIPSWRQSRAHECVHAWAWSACGNSIAPHTPLASGRRASRGGSARPRRCGRAPFCTRLQYNKKYSKKIAGKAGRPSRIHEHRQNSSCRFLIDFPAILSKLHKNQLNPSCQCFIYRVAEKVRGGGRGIHGRTGPRIGIWPTGPEVCMEGRIDPPHPPPPHRFSNQGFLSFTVHRMRAIRQRLSESLVNP